MACINQCIVEVGGVTPLHVRAGVRGRLRQGGPGADPSTQL